ncbi:MAG: hypothetical protein EKK46_13480 [Rhodocyclaceae bacterium]|nr:MAG: hypothetical protein EKK46_13480 [Rhodocyclaceae bacterium]
MLTMQDCLDYSDLSEEEIHMVAHHEHIPYSAAAHLACTLVQDKAGEKRLRDILAEVVGETEHEGRREDLQAAQQALYDYNQHHPCR